MARSDVKKYLTELSRVKKEIKSELLVDSFIIFFFKYTIHGKKKTILQTSHVYKALAIQMCRCDSDVVSWCIMGNYAFCFFSDASWGRLGLTEMKGTVNQGS